MTQRKTFDLYKSGVVVDLTIGTWLASTRLDPKDLGLSPLSTTHRDTLIWLGRKRLVRKSDMKAIRKVVNRAMNSLYYPHSFPFPFGAVQFVPFGKLPKMIETMDACEKDFWREVDLLVENYEQIRAEVLEEYSLLFSRILRDRDGDNFDPIKLDSERQELMRKLAEKYPRKSDLKSKFRFDFTVFEVASPKFKSVTRGGAVEVAVADQVFQQKIETKVDSFLGDVMLQLKGMATEMIDYMSQRVDANKINFKSVNAFKRYVESFKEMNFSGWNIQVRMDELTRKLEGVSGGKDDVVRRDLSAAMNELKKEIVNTTSDDLLGTYRLLNLEDNA